MLLWFYTTIIFFKAVILFILTIVLKVHWVFGIFTIKITTILKQSSEPCLRDRLCNRENNRGYKFHIYWVIL